MKSRRLIVVCSATPYLLRCSVNRLANALVGAAAAKVHFHGNINITIGGHGVFSYESRRRHDLPRLTVAALRNVLSYPRLLNGVKTLLRQPLDGRDFLILGVLHGGHTGAGRFTIQMNSARTAQTPAAGVLGAGQIQIVPDDPEKRGVSVYLDALFLAVDSECEAGHLWLAEDSDWMR